MPVHPRFFFGGCGLPWMRICLLSFLACRAAWLSSSARAHRPARLAFAFPQPPPRPPPAVPQALKEHRPELLERVEQQEAAARKRVEVGKGANCTSWPGLCCCLPKLPAGLLPCALHAWRVICQVATSPFPFAGAAQACGSLQAARRARLQRRHGQRQQRCGAECAGDGRLLLWILLTSYFLELFNFLELPSTIL